MANFHLFLFLVAALGCFLMAPVDAMHHIVGGSFGWSAPKNLTFYQEWAKPRTFGVGDTLVFLYRTGVHNVLQVNKKDFEECTQKEVTDMFYKGPTIVELNKPGDYYYYCGVGMHCESGQKLSITVTNEEGSSGSPFPALESMNASSPTASAPESKSSANSIRNLGLISCLLSFVLSLFI